MLELGNLKLESNIILAPMAGISDLPFRMLNRKFGAELTFVEMLNSRSVSSKSIKTKQMLSLDPDDRPLGLQLLGKEPRFIQRALEVIQQYKFDLLDFNAACPVKKVVRRGEGAALLRSPKKMKEIIKIIVRESKVPVTVKIRIGWDKDSVNAKELALTCQESGAAGVFIHGRTKMQCYSGRVDYEAIRVAKKALDIPLIASGDIFSVDLTKKMFDETGCDAVLVARGALGNPWIFKEIPQFLGQSLRISRPKPKEITAIMIEHLNMCINFYGERVGVVIFRKFFSWYTKGFRKIRPFREKISRLKTKDEVVKVIESCAGI